MGVTPCLNAKKANPKKILQKGRKTRLKQRFWGGARKPSDKNALKKGNVSEEG